MPSLSKCCGAEARIVGTWPTKYWFICSKCGKNDCDLQPTQETIGVDFGDKNGDKTVYTRHGFPSFDPIAFAEWVREQVRISHDEAKDNFGFGMLDAFQIVLSYLASRGITTKE